MFIKRLQQDERGFAALFGIITFSLLLVTISVASSRTAVSELRQSAQVDRSNRALYAAEAGVEEALQRIDDNLNSDEDLATIFPEGATTTAGDMAILTKNDGSEVSPLNIVLDDGSDGEALAWRNRVVRESSFNKEGIQVKDEIIELDLSSLNELDDNGEICGSVGSSLSCSGSPLHQFVSGIRYCPTNLPPAGLPPEDPKYEWIIFSYAASNSTDIDTSKRYIDPDPVTTPGFSLSGDGNSCLDYTLPQPTDRRYIFRIKPIFETGDLGNVDNFSQYQVAYKTELLTTSSSVGEVVIADDSILIDVTGEAGDVRRRIIAKKQRNGRLLGVFDYLLYSGDSSVPLCKAGVLYEVDPTNGVSYDLTNCDDSANTPVIQPDPTDGDTSPPPAPLPLKIEAQSFAPGSNTPDATADGGGAKRIPTNSAPSSSSISYTYPGPNTYRTIEVIARRYQKVSGTLSVRVNGVQVGSAFVSSNTYQTYTFNGVSVRSGDLITLAWSSFYQVLVDYAFLR